ncbi:lron-6, partial [Pristionchus pacificus]
SCFRRVTIHSGLMLAHRLIILCTACTLSSSVPPPHRVSPNKGTVPARTVVAAPTTKTTVLHTTQSPAKPRNTERACRPIHSQAHGVNLVCCGGNDTLTESCEFSHQCTLHETCSCSLLLTSKLNCTLNTNQPPYQWRDHSQSDGSLHCDRPNLPGNDSRTPYTVRVEQWEDNTTTPFLLSLCSLNVTTLTILDKGDFLSIWDLTKCLPRLKVLEISLATMARLDIYQLFRSLRWLETLRITNVDFDFWHSVSPWIASISYIHIENSSLRELPKWLAQAKELKRIFIQGTRVHSIDAIAEITTLQSAKLTKNEIGDLKKIEFSSSQLFDIDLSFNKISSISSTTFSDCSELRVLDLSNNPLKSLPGLKMINDNFKNAYIAGVFDSNTKLKWLKLDHTKIEILLPEHLNGLSQLRTLSISHTPLRTINAHSFVPLKSLRVLNLNACNLTEIPSAVTHLCQLTHLNLAENLFRNTLSLPSDVMVHLSSLSQLSLEGNPLKEFPPGLLLLSSLNTRLVRDTIRTLTMLPVWSAEPCTPFYFNMHLENSSVALRNLVMPWSNKRMTDGGLGHCRVQYEALIASTDVYFEIEKSSGCSVSRRLRSNSEECVTPVPVNHYYTSPATTVPRKSRNGPGRPHPLHRTRSPVTASRQNDNTTQCPVVVDSSHLPLLYLSVALNAFFVTTCSVFLCLCCAASRKMRY